MYLPISNWFYDTYEICDHLCPAGSPERCVERHVIKLDSDQRQFVIEGCSLGKLHHRTHQAEMLHELEANHCPKLAPWFMTRANEWGAESGELFWQLRPWIDGNDLPRDTYGNDAWRGDVMADFLIALKKSSSDIHCHVTPFSICEYIRALLPRIREKNPALLDDLLPIWQELDEFSRAETTLPIDFCHGDFHPNNVLWGDGQLNGVIDWEFSGHKVAGYDVATLLGCLGMDNPEFLTADMTFAFLNKLKANDFHSDIVWHWLPDYIAATRFAWMREWCWANNKELIIQELDFLWLILDNRDFLRTRWKL